MTKNVHPTIWNMKSETPPFVLELQLKTTPVQEPIILTRLETGRQLYNACLGEALKRLDLIRQSREFKKAKNVRFKGKNQFDTLEGKNNCTGLIFRDITLFWSGLEPVLSAAVSRVIQFKPEATITEAVADVIRDQIYEDESHREVI